MTEWAYDRSLRTIDADGHMRVEMSRISKAAINPYRGSEIPKWRELGLDPDRIYRLFRDPRELAKGAQTFDGKPLLMRHVPVTSDLPNRDSWVGSIGRVSFEEPYLVARPLTVLTQDAIDAIESHAQRELSSAYRYDAEMVPGSWGGEAYDGRMVNIRGNHVAIVSEGRAGSDVHVADELPEDLKIMSKRVAAIAKLLKPHLPSDVNASTIAMALDGELGEMPAESVITLDAREEDLDKREDAMDAAEGKREDDEAAKDAAEEKEDKDKDDDKAKDRKRARDERCAARDKARGARDSRKGARDSRRGARDSRAKDAKVGTTQNQGGDSQVDHRKDFDPIKAKDELSRTLKAELQAQFRDAAVAREAVRPIVGVVSMALDSADAIYEHALKHAGVETKGVHASAFPALLDMAVKAKKQQPAARSGSLAMDSGSSEDVDALLGLKDVAA